MANDIDKTSPHYKGDFGSIYEVNKKFPTGGVAGDFVVIEGWAHYWNADRATWCVNAERDSYWDELITNIIEKFKLIRGATYMGVASLDTVPAKVIGAKMYYFATVAGTYKNFGDLVVPQGINVLYSENGSSWVNTTLLEVAQELGVSTNKVVSQKALNDALNLKANQSSVNEALAKKANKEEMNRLLATKANTTYVDTELAKKFDKKSVVQESGEAEDKVMSQKAVSDKLSDLSKKAATKFYFSLNTTGECSAKFDDENGVVVFSPIVSMRRFNGERDTDVDIHEKLVAAGCTYDEKTGLCTITFENYNNSNLTIYRLNDAYGVSEANVYSVPNGAELVLNIAINDVGFYFYGGAAAIWTECYNNSKLKKAETDIAKKAATKFYFSLNTTGEC
ncbi:hypothetical protein, partial [Leyella stercorea]|uniref:hypothetical protein n=1 Tax=Leyella stercorea TaxID=363265 RepID=UPI00242A5BE0